jgi:hypothetical protein
MRGASNYVAKLSADVLNTENLESLGHIFDFATLPVRFQGRYLRRGLPVLREVFASAGLRPSFVPTACRVSTPFCVGGRCALVHFRASGFCRSTPGALAPVRVILSRSINA